MDLNKKFRRGWQGAFPVVMTLLVSSAQTAWAQAPTWWTNRNVVVTNSAPLDFAPVNQGQIKWLATNCAAEFNAMLIGVGGANEVISNLLQTFSSTNNYLAANVGQIKATSQPFYDLLAQLMTTESYLSNALPMGVVGPYPWTTNTTDDVNYALANVGQAKFAFSIDFDRDGSGLPDWWEVKYFGATGINPNAYPNSSNHNYLWLYQNGANPTNFPPAIVLTITAPPDGAVVGGY